MFGLFKSKTPHEKLEAKIRELASTLFSRTFRNGQHQPEMVQSMTLTAAYGSFIDKMSNDTFFFELQKSAFGLPYNFSFSDYQLLVKKIAKNEIEKYIEFQDNDSENDHGNFYD